MSQIRACLFQGRNSESLRRLAPPEALELREHEPHPMTAFVASPDFGERGGVYAFLSSDEALEVVPIVIHGEAMVR